MDVPLVPLNSVEFSQYRAVDLRDSF